MSQHSPEPWLITTDPVYGRFFNIATQKRIDAELPCMMQVDGYSDDPEVEEEQHANVRRIVACVNACAGISTELLEQQGIKAVLAPSESSKTMAEASRLLIQSNARQLHLTEQRDELLAALIGVVETWDVIYPHIKSSEHSREQLEDAEFGPLQTARSTIAKCEVPS